MKRNGRARVRNDLARKIIGGVMAAGMIFQAAACGPITTTNNVAKARVAIAAADAAGAEQQAVYEFVSAQAYLRKAREEEGFSDFQAAIDYAAKAQDFAEKAKARADAKRASAEAPAVAPRPATPGVPAPTPAPTPAGPSGSSL